ncbi:protein zer-1 homolog [Pieris rapae]|uniref:protein zer-1 homolog n=1 Tax=Pieris rapae TaxID=64459 RepID=UPI000B92B38C|nr:protein zer-1 homolog [Pieris rapae]
MWYPLPQEILSLNDMTPGSLFDQCLSVITDNLDAISIPNPTTRSRVLRRNIVLPAQICDKFLEAYQKKYRLNDSIAHIFRDRESTRLTIVKLEHATITDKGLRYLLAHRPLQVELVHCDCISEAAVGIIAAYNQNLVRLTFGPLNFTSNSRGVVDNHIRMNVIKRDLLQLTLKIDNAMTIPVLRLKPLHNITFLNLSKLPEMLSSLQMRIETVKFLILHNVPLTPNNIKWILQVSDNIKLLDISQENEAQGTVENASSVLHELVTNLPKLQYLDISGTNLAGTGQGQSLVTTVDGGEVEVKSDIPGLISRATNPLEFLGLYGTHHGACQRHDIPASLISGDANEKQILTAAWAAIDYPVILSKVLSDLYYFFRFENITNVGAALSIVLLSLKKFPLETQIQISGSAIIYYIVKGNQKANIGLNLKRRIITLLLDSMETHISDHTLMRNGCLALCQFRIPEDVLFEYDRIVQILLDVSEDSHYTFVQRIAIYLLNSLACQVDGQQKLFLGDRGAITRMLHVISLRVDRRQCDDVMEVAWSTMWNVTDETPINCQRFLDGHGMTYFLACLRWFRGNFELVRNMMGLLGNVAEVAALRPKLMRPVIIMAFYNLLNSVADGIEVSYNAAGVIAHIASDGPEAWTIREPSRTAVLNRMSAAIHRWDRKAERNINYRSFHPILNLLNARHTPECQQWAVWALANLTTVYPEKYCKLLEREGGIEMLKELLHPNYSLSNSSFASIKRLVIIVITNCENFSNEEVPPDQMDH